MTSKCAKDIVRYHYQCELLGRNLGLLESGEVASMAAAIRKLRTLLEIE